MRIVSNQVSHSFASRLEASGVTVAEWVVLREMFGGSSVTTPSAVAELTGLTRGAVSKLLNRLLEKGLVGRRGSTGDRRYQEIRLTDAARVLVPKLARLADENDEQFFGALAEPERSALRRSLVRLAEHHGFNRPPID